MTLYVAASVYLLAWLGFWTWPNLKSTLLWWLTVGFTSVFEASRLKERPDAFRKLVLEAFTITAVLVSVVELVSFPLWVELLTLPALVVLTLFAAVAEQRPENAVVFRLLQGVQVLAGLFILGISLVQIMESAAEFWSLNTLREFALPFLLWLQFDPFILLLAAFMTYEEAFLALKVRPRNAPIVRYARWRALLAFGWNMVAVRRLSQDLRIWDIGDKAGVRDAIREIKKMQRRQKDPPLVSSADGWSPYELRLILKEHEIVTGDYHRTPWGWRADAPAVKLSDKAFADSISYVISGNEYAATQLHLSLDGWKGGDSREEAQRAFDVRALRLLSNIFGSWQAEEVLARAESAASATVEVDDVQVSYDSREWGEGSLGHYCLELTVQHPRHVRDD